MAPALAPGDTAPLIALDDQDGTERRSDQLDGKALVLFFYPKDDTPGCTMEACAFRDSYADLQGLGAEVWGVSGDDAASHRRFANRHRLPFPLLVDGSNRLRKAFGVPSVLGLLPGSRLPEALHNLELMLAVLAQLPEHLQQPDQLGLSAALVGRLGPEEVAPLASRLGWRLDSEAGTITRLRRGPLRLELVWGRFAAVVQHSDLVLSMTGTAAEQAVGLGKPVLQLVGSGPQFTDNFAEAQRRLLGPSVFCAEGRSGSAEQRDGTAHLLAQLLGELQREGALAERCHRNGLERIGAGGGTARIADAVVDALGQVPPGGPHG